MATLANQGVASQVSFGQHGSAFIDGDASLIVPPAGKSIVAIQCLGDTLFDILVAEDAEQFINIGSTANGVALDQVAADNSTSDPLPNRFIDFSAAATALSGDFVYSSTGVFQAIVKNVGFDSSGVANSHRIELDRDITVADSAVLHFAGKQEGGGGGLVDNGNVFPKGITIYGRWQAVSLKAAQASDGVICYFGPSAIKRDLGN